MIVFKKTPEQIIKELENLLDHGYGKTNKTLSQKRIKEIKKTIKKQEKIIIINELKDKMTNEFLQTHLGYLIHDLGEVNFKCIKDDFWEFHINKEISFTQNQTDCFKQILNNIFEELINN